MFKKNFFKSLEVIGWEGFKIRRKSAFFFILFFCLIFTFCLSTVCASTLNQTSSFENNQSLNSSETGNVTDTPYEDSSSSSFSNDYNNGLIYSNIKAAGSPTTVYFNAKEVTDSAIWVKNYVEINHKLPTKVNINGTDVSIYTFYYLLSTVVQNLYNHNNNPVASLVFSQPQIVRDDIHSGNVVKSEYIKIADVVKVYMDRTGIVPGYAYQTSLGTYFSYQSLIYMYCKILDSYNTNKILPNSIAVKPWKFVSDPNARSFTNQQIIDAAIVLKNNIETNHNLPNTVTVNGTNVNIYTFYYLLSTAVQNLNSRNNNPVDSMSFNGPQIFKDNIHSGYVSKGEYIGIADVVKVYMDHTGIVPGYAYGTSVGTYFSYKSLIYMYCKVLDTYNNTKNLPASVGVKPWKVLSDPNARTFTNKQIVDAAVLLKGIIETNHDLPTTVRVDGSNVGVYTFLYLLSTTVQNLNSKNPNSVDVSSFSAPQIIKDDLHLGSMPKSEYIGIADVVKVYMDRTGVTPGYAYQTSIGTYFSYKSLIYMYCKVLNNYNTNNVLPGSVTVKPWRIVTDPNIPTFNNDQIITAALWVKNYIETKNNLPSKVNINGADVTMPTFLEILSTVVQNIYKKSSEPVDGIPFNSPQTLKEEIHVGSMNISEYIKIAHEVKNYMDTTWIAPGYAHPTSLGPHFSYSSLIYMYCKVLCEYNNTKTLPNTISVIPWNRFSVEEVILVASLVNYQVATTRGLPSTVTINGVSVGLPSFLQIVTTAVLHINSETTSELIYNNYCNPSSTLNEGMNYGDMSFTEYIDIAGDVKSFTEDDWIIPGYAYGTSLGTYFGCYNMIYTYSRVLTYYHEHNVLPKSIPVQPWISVLLPQLRNYPSNLASYTWPTRNCQSDDVAINNLAYKIVATSSSPWNACSRIMGWVQDNVEYVFYYNTRYGARGTLNNMHGNCVDQSHLVIALARAVGIPARYLHGTCNFIISGRLGHVWPELFINGGWVFADASSTDNELGVIRNWYTSSSTIQGYYTTLPF